MRALRSYSVVVFYRSSWAITVEVLPEGEINGS
jgi:hypothetical protein